MKNQITASEIAETIAKAKGWNVLDIKSLDINNETFQKGNSVYMFSLTPKKTMVKLSSIKFLWTATNYNKCSYGE